MKTQIFQNFGQKGAKNDHFWPKMVIFGPKWSFLAHFGDFWPKMDLFDQNLDFQGQILLNNGI